MVGVNRFKVAEYLRRAGILRITWPVPAELGDAALERKLFTPPFAAAEPTRPQPVWPRVHVVLRRTCSPCSWRGRNIERGNRKGYGYSRFCDLYARLGGRLAPTKR